MSQNTKWWILLPFGVFLLFMLTRQKPVRVTPQILEETSDAYIVKTENYEEPLVDTVRLPNVKVQFGQRDNRVVIKSFEYSKNRYSEEDVRRIMREQLAECPRCTI